MTVLEYFDYEIQLIDDMQNVKTLHARNAIQAELMKMLKDHKQFVYNTIKQFEDKIHENTQIAGQVLKGQTPDYVKKMMAEFGFYELEECDDVVSPPNKFKNSGPSGKKLTAHRIKQLCEDVDVPLDAQDAGYQAKEQEKTADGPSAAVETPAEQKPVGRKRAKKAQK